MNTDPDTPGFDTPSAPGELSEKQTRALIDSQLRQVGWEADTAKLRYALGTRPSPGRNIAIAEWPVNSDIVSGGFADYALFIGEQLIGLIEAKKWGKDITAELDYQGREYARSLRPEDLKYSFGSWGAYRVPFIFSTNGRAYSEQLRTHSGIWWLDLRRDSNTPDALHGWMSPEGLLHKLSENIADKNQRLETLSRDLLTDPAGLNLRPYQLKAINAAEQAIIDGRRNILLAMATGTGKTRTVLGMIYRFLKSERFRRILFLVDRTELGEQALDVFREVRLEDLLTLDAIYNIKGLSETLAERETRIHVSTVQGLVKRLLYAADDERKPAVSDYDLIIVDEAHRGYILDKEMSQAELFFSDQRDYQSKYRSVIDYFDAVKIGLTATPALHTTQIFGAPVFIYSYAEAVLDGYLVDHDAPHLITTKLSRDGIRFAPGEDVSGYYAGEEVQHWEIADEINYDVDQFNRRVITEAFNREVLCEVARDIDPEASKTQGKTLIFAVNDKHADLIVNILRDIYAPQGVDSRAILKITGSVANGSRERIREAIRRFKNEEYPSIVVTVDLLTTGVDVPSITKLVFLRRVKSRILFEQMKGRATRLCPEINKDHFDIYDCVGVCEAMQQVDTMQPIGASPGHSFTELIDGLNTLSDPELISEHISHIIVKLRRKILRVTEAERRSFNSHFADHTEGSHPAAFIESLRNQPPREAKETLLSHRPLFVWLDQVHLRGVPTLISDKPDGELRHSRGFGSGTMDAEDYLQAFTRFIRENRDKITALNLICTKPADLTRQALKSLERELARAGYTEQQLNTALSQLSNADIAADIISIIRQQAMGIPLQNHLERISRAIAKLRQAHSFSKTELNWLERIEKYLINESVLTRGTFDEEQRFRQNGGFRRLNQIFDGKLDALITELNQYLYHSERTA